MSGNTRLETPPSLPQDDSISSSISYSSDDLCNEADCLSFPTMSPLLHSALTQTGSQYGATPHPEDGSRRDQEGHAENGCMASLSPGGAQPCDGEDNAMTTVADTTSMVLPHVVGSSTLGKDAGNAATCSDDQMDLGDDDANKATLLSSGDSDDYYDDDECLGDERLPSDEEEIELDSEDDDDDDEDDEDSDDEDEEEDGEEEEESEKEQEDKELEGKTEEAKEEVQRKEEVEEKEKTESEEKEEKTEKQEGLHKEPKPEASLKGKSKVSAGKKRKRTTTKGRKEKKKRLKVKKAVFERRNIRKLISENALDAGTLAAQMEERERKRRILELRENFQQQREQMQPQLSELQSLLDDELDGDPMPSFLRRNSSSREAPEVDKAEKALPHADYDVVEISSSEEDEEEDNDVVMVHSDHEDEEEGEGDVNNSGSHINDEMNQPDAQGRVLVNIGHPHDEPDIYLLPQIARVVKPHQIGGIRFLYDNLVEALARYKTSHGFGCVLAHSMGLGKTIQLVAFIDIFLKYTGAKHVMVIVPVNTLQNWMFEFNLWTPTADVDKANEGCDTNNVVTRHFDVHVLNDNHRTMVARAKVVNDWFKGGGVLLIGYEMYRLLTSRKYPAARGRKAKTKGNDPVIIDLIEEDQNNELATGIHEALMRPGPDLVICDEGHRIKNSHAGISKALKNIKTRRRVVLTGYPLQNNLLEYWCMVDFVRPNFLGSRTEFGNMFERPIMNGQCLDSNVEDVRLMRFRAHVLHSLLEGFVQRRGHDVLTSTLPIKEEYTLLIRMSPVQRQLYTEFMGQVNFGDTGWVSTNPLKAFAICCKIWNHPDVLYTAAQKQKKNSLVEDNDIDFEEIQEAAAGAKKTGSKAGKPGAAPVEQNNQSSPRPMHEMNKAFAMMDRKDQSVGYEWADELLKNYAPGILENSGKMLLMISLIDGAVRVNDKTLIFSQSLFTLDLIEEFLSRRTVPRAGEEEEEKEGGKKWQKNVNYVRLDGSTSGMEREKLINQFNNPENKAIHVFLLSTRAGCLGINLIGANRVIVFDASWNPCHDSQAVCRVYRYGQRKECFVYRLVTDNTMEKKIYDRQLNKQGISDRVVDELNPQSAFTRRQVDVLLQYQDQDLPHVDISKYLDEKCNDPVLIDVLKEHHPWLSREPFCHDRKSSGGTEQKLTKTEKQLARRGYEMEKRLSVNFSRPSYSNFCPKNSPYGQLPPPLGVKEVFPRNRPIASVPPMMSTPVPQRVRTGEGQSETGRFPVQAIMRPGVSVQQILTTTDIIVPGTNSTTNAQNSRIPAGENVLVIKTPRGVYLRTRQGKIFAVRTNQNETGVSVSETTACVTSTASDTTIAGLSTLATTVSTTTSTSCSSYVPPAAATAAAMAAATAAATAATTATAAEKPDITDAPSSDGSSQEEASDGEMEKAMPSPKPVPAPAAATTQPIEEGNSTGAEENKSGAKNGSDLCTLSEKPSGASFPGGAMAPPPFYNYPGLYGGYHGMMPQGNMYGTTTGGASSASDQKNHSSYMAPNSYAPMNMPPSDMMFGGYSAPSWMSQFTSSWPQHFPDFMQQPPPQVPNSQNGKTDGQGTERREEKEGSVGSRSQDMFVENTDSVDDSLAAFDSLLGLSNTTASSSQSTTTPTTRGSPTMPDWHSGYGMPPYMAYQYPMQTSQSCGMPPGSSAGGMAGQMPYMRPLYSHSHPSFMSGGYVHSMPPAGMGQSSYNMPPISAFDAGQKMLQSVAGDNHSEGNGGDKDKTQGASTS